MRVQEILKTIKKRKPETEQRYPFALTGFISCSTCGERLVGKSAHGNGGKVPYYEHGWAVSRQSCLVKKCFDCTPFRIQAKKIEPAVWEAVQKLLADPEFAERIIKKAHGLHENRTQNSEAKRIRDKINSLKGQLEVLAERLAELPEKRFRDTGVQADGEN